eukprot:1136661-Pelagomonas_calceolata.AAC.1
MVPHLMRFSPEPPVEEGGEYRCAAGIVRNLALMCGATPHALLTGAARGRGGRVQVWCWLVREAPPNAWHAASFGLGGMKPL